MEAVRVVCREHRQSERSRSVPAPRKVLRLSRDKSSARERAAILRRRGIRIGKTLQDRFGTSRYAQGTLEFRIYPVWLFFRNARSPDY